MKRMNTYVDGFNLYYGCLKGAPFNWLGLLCSRAVCESSSGERT